MIKTFHVSCWIHKSYLLHFLQRKKDSKPFQLKEVGSNIKSEICFSNDKVLE